MAKAAERPFSFICQSPKWPFGATWYRRQIVLIAKKCVESLKNWKSKRILSPKPFWNPRVAFGDQKKGQGWQNHWEITRERFDETVQAKKLGSYRIHKDWIPKKQTKVYPWFSLVKHTKNILFLQLPISWLCRSWDYQRILKK